MKTIKLLPLLFLSLILTSCGIPDGNFWTEKATIVKKVQDQDDKNKHQAKFTIRFTDNNRSTCDNLILILPEDFGDVGDVVHGTNRTLYASPQLENTR